MQITVNIKIEHPFPILNITFLTLIFKFGKCLLKTFILIKK